MPLLIAELLALSAAIIVLYPLLGLGREAAPEAAPGRLAAAAERERQARQALREVEFDYTLGNLAGDDYQELRGRYEERALTALKARYLREQELDAQIERRLDALRQAEAAADAAPVTTGDPAPAKTAKAPATPRAATRSGATKGGASARARRASQR
ncbi:MAG: hypothetical protein KGO05_07750, partial [Chloroflexota bacterium]|nr:hypothetical protein [Chloroflexota bacterium]